MKRDLVEYAMGICGQMKELAGLMAAAASEKEESAPSTSSNIPMDEIAWCGRAFEYMIEDLLPEQQGIWKQHRDAVLAQLRHR